MLDSGRAIALGHTGPGSADTELIYANSQLCSLVRGVLGGKQRAAVLILLGTADPATETPESDTFTWLQLVSQLNMPLSLDRPQIEESESGADTSVGAEVTADVGIDANLPPPPPGGATEKPDKAKRELSQNNRESGDIKIAERVSLHVPFEKYQQSQYASDHQEKASSFSQDANPSISHVRKPKLSITGSPQSQSQRSQSVAFSPHQHQRRNSLGVHSPDLAEKDAGLMMINDNGFIHYCCFHTFLFCLCIFFSYLMIRWKFLWPS